VSLATVLGLISFALVSPARAADKIVNDTFGSG
jgi:hypothetical protein